MLGEDHQIIEQLKCGSTTALESLHSKYAKQLYISCRRYYLSHEDAEEIVQDVFLKIWDHRDNIKDGYPFRSYLFTIAKNAILKFSRHKIISYSIDNYLENLDGLQVHHNIENKIELKETKDFIESVIRSLPPQKQKIYILSRLEGLSHEQIAKRLGLSVRTVENHTYHTNLMLKKKLGLN